MFGLYEILTICAFYTVGYNTPFYAILGIVTHDIAYRINTEVAISVALIGSYLINILGVINMACFIAIIFSCFCYQDIIVNITGQLVGLRDRLQATPQGQRLLAATIASMTFMTMLFHVMSDNSYVKPFTTTQKWIELGRSIRDGVYEAHTSLYSFSSTMIRDPIIEKGGVRAERIISCWFIVRKEVVTFITINRVKFAQFLISAKSSAPMIIEMAKSYANMSDNSKKSKSTNSIMSGNKNPTLSSNTISTIPSQSDTMELMRDFIETKEAAPEQIVPVQSATVKREQRQAVQSAMLAPSTSTSTQNIMQGTTPENMPEIREMVLKAFASKGIIWAKESATSRARHINKFNEMLVKMNINLGHGVLAEILNSK